MRGQSGPLRVALVVLVALIAGAAVLVRAQDVGPATTPVVAYSPPASPAPVALPYGTGAAPVRVAVTFKRAPRAGLLFDLRSGRVLWSRGVRRRAPVASLAKMMTAIVVVDLAQPGELVPITRQALGQDGSKVGLLPPRRSLRLETLLHGLLLPSGNDAAVALAQHVTGSVPEFVRQMNATGRRMGLTCTSFSSPHGLQDAGNFSCARDLAVIARELMARPRLARIVGRQRVALPSLLPRTIRRGKRKRTVWRPGLLHMSNHNPLLRAGYPGTTGIKTGYTDAAGRCLVGTVRRRGTTLGVVLLGSPDPGAQATRLLDRGFAGLRRPGRIPGLRPRAPLQ